MILDADKIESIQKERAMWRKTITLNDELVKKLNEEIAKLRQGIEKVEQEINNLKESNKNE